MVINIALSNKTFYLLVGITILMAAIGIVYAYGGNQPAVMGHSFSEIEMPNCEEGQVLKISNGEWSCGIDLQGSGGGITLPSCSNNQVIKWSGSAWVCANDINTNAQTICGNNQYLRGDGTCRTPAEIVTSGSGGLESYPLSCSGSGCYCDSTCAEGFALTSWTCQWASNCYVGSNGRTGYAASGSPCTGVSGSGTCTKI